MKTMQSVQQKRIAYCVRRISYAIRNTQYVIRTIWQRLSFGLLIPVSLILLILPACASSANAEPPPPVIHYGEDVCEFCNMIISDERYAAGYITEDGQQHIFDDIGNMFRNHLQKPGKVTAFFVHNYASKAWIRAEKAIYVQSAELTTPMLSGLAAFESPEKANALAAEMQGHVMTFDEVLAYYKANPMPQGEHSMEHDH